MYGNFTILRQTFVFVDSTKKLVQSSFFTSQTFIIASFSRNVLKLMKLEVTFSQNIEIILQLPERNSYSGYPGKITIFFYIYCDCLAIKKITYPMNSN